MAAKCDLCGCTEDDSLANAKTLGLDEELRNGVYTCCQITAWARDQLLAWFEATYEDMKLVPEKSMSADLPNIPRWQS